MPEDTPGEGADDAREAGCYLACFPARPIKLNKDRPTTIGRADGNTIVLADSDVSRKHAVVEWRDGSFHVRDLESRNGIYVNDERVTETALTPDDRVRVGNRVFTFLSGDEQAVRRLFMRKRQEKHSGATDVLELDAVMRPTSGFAGSLADFGLAELLQALEVSRKTGKVVLFSEGKRGEMMISEGQVVDATVGQLRAEEAVYDMLGIQTGRFEFENEPVDVEPVIRTKTAMLLMEGFRLMDEAIRASADGSSPAEGAADGEAPAEDASAEDGSADGAAAETPGADQGAAEHIMGEDDPSADTKQG